MMSRVLYARPPVFCQRLAERLEQRAIDRVLLRIVFGVPLHPEREAPRIRNADGLDGAVLGDALDHHPSAWLQNALAVQRIDPDGLTPQDFRERAARRQAHLVAICDDDSCIGMD